MRLGRISQGPLFRPIARKNGGVSAERLTDKHVARLVQKTALAAGIRGDLTEGERRLRLRRPFAARRARLLGADRGGACAKTSRPRLRRNDPPLPAQTRPFQGQSHQGRRALRAPSISLNPAFNIDLRGMPRLERDHKRRATPLKAVRGSA